ncbi:glycosyl hydrolase [Pontiellaceae bacterium B12227]|nr:glycosyl hydrolase [Pontiellaceae bacterium B12227]
MSVQSSNVWKFSGVGFLLVVGCLADGGEPEKLKYPFDVPETVTASVSVDTGRQTSINNMLLGLNANWPENLYGKIGYNHSDAQKLIRQFRPSSLRFPHGVWANFYDWESDGRRKTDNYKTPYDGSVTNHPTLKYGFDGLHQLHRELKFDAVFTYNLNYDSPEKGVRRLKDRKVKGFDVRWIELGNEPFWKTQRSEATKTVEDYIAVSKAYTTALKATDPDVKVSVPVHWRDAVSNPWNQPFLNEDYFDAITVHKHMGGGAKATLFTGQVLSEMADTFRELFPDHPIWLTEWSTGKGDNAISVLGMADGYLTLFENQDIYEIACFFQMNAGHPLFTYDKKTGVHTKTGFGAAYEMVRDLFEDAQLLGTTVETQRLAEGRSAVRAVSVVKDEKIAVFVINKTPLHVPLSVQVKGYSLKQTPVLRALYFDEVNETKHFTVDEAPDVEIPLEDGRLVLPPLSISRIEL